ncbi:hypothetical protein CcaverHIS002_0308670 [Cutaneotrichosporon cavernicola]|uniref:Uncharacterized protein n=1 Tax=Cutaneotrichosporon cavernicola TaxID=279322 RepID=A0AA48ID76_9TREE|nr:uncharacterized protein CcaverHIS019_0308520 [Cutaneotrichosporon cavernicola]BEI82999.1 hypothetical protein CcaverHIS002_0308670 [Cutaneotrichosporon cavernicola]BEI90782.1 hypothetical protein CcaverHIS019_0308520 [Cutaneotrichosporon cavernicola]BEI98561.1 hypothetical protein CcaverHIS631_0308600 [Cutaneotrichosporon cavernicola]BEJ06332.1 hypothetical protein CcaverHIS641_0308540 [Cutaneotrichosporon cavernicola]
MSHAPPPGPPPRPNQDSNPFNDAVPDDPPPAYEAISGDSTLSAGPSRMDFSGPPPLPDRLTRLNTHSTGGYSIPGVGVGYNPASPSSPGGQGYYSPQSHAPPALPARHTNSPHSQADHTPTESPIPGRALLHHGNLLVYPKGYWCNKCQNTGYKGGDPRSPCSSDWRKYGKAYSGALAASFAAPRPGGNASVVGANNFQQPLPAGGQQNNTPQLSHHGNGGYPGHQAYRPPPPRPQMHHTYAPPPGALVVQPGDPRIGGQLCYRCGGSGREASLFMFDDGPCYQCRGVGRVF